MNRIIDGVTSGKRPGPVGFGRPFTQGEPTFGSRLTGQTSKDRPSGSTLERGSPPNPTNPGGRTFTATKTHKKYQISEPKKSWKERLQLPVIIIGGMLAGFAIQNALLGQTLILLYGIAAFIYKIPSRVSFLAALAALFTMFGLLFLNGNPALSHTFAIYTFLFLVVGVITLNREIKQEGGRIYSRRYR